MADNHTRYVRTGMTLFGILRAVAEMEKPTPAEIATREDLARSTVYEHLSTLQKERFVAKTDDSYQLGLKLLDYGIQARGRFEIAEVSRPSLEHLAESTEGLASLYVEEHGHAVCLDEVKGEHAVLTVEQVGSAVPLHAISTGKIFLAEKSEAEVEQYIDEYGLTELTENTITDPQVLKSDLDKIRQQGHSLNDEETVTGLRAVACPVYDDELTGAVAVAGPSKWLHGSRKDEIVDTMFEATNEIELKLAYSE